MKINSLNQTYTQSLAKKSETQFAPRTNNGLKRDSVSFTSLPNGLKEQISKTSTKAEIEQKSVAKHLTDLKEAVSHLDESAKKLLKQIKDEVNPKN